MKETSVLTALGIGLCITIVYLLIVWLLDLPSGLDVIYYYLVFPFIVFGGTVFLYYIFMHFRQEDKLVWFFSAAGGIAFIIFFSSGFMQMDIGVKNLLNSSKPPKDDSSYQDIDSAAVLTYGQHRIKAQFSSDAPIKTWYNPAHELIVITEQVKGNSHAAIYEGNVHCSKLDLNGKVVDSLTYLRNHQGAWETDRFFAGYHMDLETMTYHTWALDGDSSQRKISVVNEKLEMSKAEQKEEYLRIAKKYLFFPVYTSGLEKYTILLFIEDGECKAFYYNIYPDDGWLQSRGNTNNNIFTTYSKEKMEWVPIESATVVYKHYYKQKRVRGTSNIGGNSGSSTWKMWHGVLYTDLLVGSDTLKIKESLAMRDDGFMDNVTINGKTLGHVVFSPYVLLENPQLNYQLLSRGTGHIHIIQPTGK